MPRECFNCGISEEKTKLFDSISKEGIVKICGECASKENIPLIKKRPENRYFSHNNLTKKESVYERLSRMSGVSLRKMKSEEEEKLLKKQEIALKNIVNKNYCEQSSKEPRPDFLIDNFHWVIMRRRRAKHITQEQLAREINEPEKAIKMIERGIIPRGVYDLIEKIEKALDIIITKKEFSKQLENKPKKIGFDTITTKNLTISDLKEMQKQKENKIFNNSKEKELNEEKKNNKDLFEDDDLIFDEEY
jgi:ribosome-binding protein aMBF1 (putative translation factor)